MPITSCLTLLAGRHLLYAVLHICATQALNAKSWHTLEGQKFTRMIQYTALLCQDDNHAAYNCWYNKIWTKQLCQDTVRHPNRH